jgi:hypothetical protein
MASTVMATARISPPHKLLSQVPHPSSRPRRSRPLKPHQELHRRELPRELLRELPRELHQELHQELHPEPRQELRRQQRKRHSFPRHNRHHWLLERTSPPALVRTRRRIDGSAHSTSPSIA